jgi:hypothetical protein
VNLIARELRLSHQSLKMAAMEKANEALMEKMREVKNTGAE